MAINAYISSPQPITANVQPLTPEQAGVENYYYIKGDTGPQGPLGPQGPDGTTFTPSVNADGDISWSNDGGKTNPPTVNIKGPQGPAGGMYYAVCDTAAGTVQKEITVAEITALSAGLSVNVKFAHANSATAPTLKVNTLDAKPIYQYGTTVAGATAATTGWQDGAVVQLTYDGTGWVRDQGYNTNTTYNISHVQCVTSASTAAKTASCSYYALRTGNTFIIVFRYSNTKAAALTLAINSTTAKPIYINGAASSSTNYTLPAGTYLCYYDGTAYQIRTDGSSPVPNSIPDGGTTGQILKKNSSTDYDVSWANESGYVTSVDGKTGAVTVLPVGGASGKVLKKNSATDYDVTWGDADARNIWYATCTTATGTADKVATSATGDFVLATGNMCVVNFTYYNNQTEPYLSIDGCTKKRIKDRSGTGQITTALWRGGECVTVVYDGTDFIVVEGGTATTSDYGVVKLSNSHSSTSQSLAATPQAVKDAYDLADSKVSVPAGGSTGQALLKVSNTDHDVAWGSVPSGTMYYPNQAVSVANNAEMLRITDVAITTQTVVTEVTFDGPVTVTSWTSYDGYFAIYGTCTTATTANVTLSNVDTPSPTVPLAVANGGTGANNAADARTNLGILDYIYPVGSIYMSTVSTSPAVLFGGTWTQLEDRFLLGAGTTYTAGDTGGEASHTLTETEIPSHRHTINSVGQAGTGTSSYGGVRLNQVFSDQYTGYTGGGGAHNNMPPYRVVYMWERTA